MTQISVERKHSLGRAAAREKAEALVKAELDKASAALNAAADKNDPAKATSEERAIRALLGGMTLSNIDALSRDDARRLSPQEVDPIDEEAQTATPTPTTAPKAAGRKKARSSRDPLVDTTPFGSEPAAASAEATAHADDDGDAALFGTLWPLGDVVKLDATVDRRVLRQQRDRLGDLGYEFAPLSQDWHLARV